MHAPPFTPKFYHSLKKSSRFLWSRENLPRIYCENCTEKNRFVIPKTFLTHNSFQKPDKFSFFPLISEFQHV